MQRSLFLLYCSFVLLIIDLHLSHAAEPVALKGLQALLFNSKTGSFSSDVLAHGGSEQLGNVPTGSFASVSTFVIVKLQIGKDVRVPGNLKVRLSATELGAAPFAVQKPKARDEVILNATADIGPANEGGCGVRL